jgi:hypothetical protein
MARWYGMNPNETRAMLLTDFWMLDGFLLRHPPVDLLAAAYMGVKPPEKRGAKGKPAMREIARQNAEALRTMPPRKHVRTLDQMPAFLRTPEKLAAIEKMRAEWQTTS